MRSKTKRNTQSNQSGKSKAEMRNFKSRKGKGSYDKQSMTDKDVKESGNDPAWYAADPAILRDAASFPFSYVTGASEIHDATAYGANVNIKPYSSVAGVCTEYIYPCIGTALTATDPINVAAQSVYSFVRHANSGSSNYDSPDLMIYILAMANMYSFLVWCQRLYGYALTYDQRNRYLPKELIRTNDVDPDDLINNLANFRFWINTLIAKMASFAVPATMSIFSRMSFMYSDYYIEGTSIKDQVYQFAPEGFYQFGLDSGGKGQLQWKPFNYANLMSINDVMTYGDALFSAIWAEEDFGIMSGDVLKAYGDRIIKLTSIPEYYVIQPKFDAMVLTQMKNADITRVEPSNISQNNTGQITQTLVPKTYTTSDTYVDGTPLSASGVTRANNAMTGILNDYNVLTVDTDNPTPEVVIEATRLKVAYDRAKLWYKVGTEVVTRVGISTMPGTSENVYALLVSSYSAGGDFIKPILTVEEALRMFHYLPRISIAVQFNDGTKVDVYSWFDIDNFTVLTFKDIAKLHEAAVINMFAVPSIGKIM